MGSSNTAEARIITESTDYERIAYDTDIWNCCTDLAFLSSLLREFHIRPR